VRFLEEFVLARLELVQSLVLGWLEEALLPEQILEEALLSSISILD
jgi:hypothetical protein